MTRGHIRTPSALLYAEGLSEGATRLWQVLDDLCREQNATRATVHQVAAAVSRDPKVPVSTRSVARWRAELVEAGWLEHEPAGNRGEVSFWRPLRRARPVDKSTGRVTGRVTGLSPSDQEKGDSPVTLDGRATRARVQEHKRTDWWCERCDERTRLLEVEDSTRHDGIAVVKCPSCHPAVVPAF